MFLLSAAVSGSFADDTRLYDRSVGSTNFLLDYWWLWALAIVALVLGFWFSGVRRKVAALEARCRSAFGDIDALLSERHALIPNLVAVTKEHADQDLEVLDRLIDAHQAAIETMGHNRLSAETEVGHALNQLVNIAGSMPELSSSSQFPELRRELSRIEERVTAARRYYNTSVAEYEAVRGGFLSELMARLSGLPRHARYDLGEQREAISAPQRVAFG